MKVAKGSNPTALELRVLAALRDGLDPWAAVGGVGSRKVSGALARLVSRGLAVHVRDWHVTSAGKRALAAGDPS